MAETAIKRILCRLLHPATLRQLTSCAYPGQEHRQAKGNVSGYIHHDDLTNLVKWWRPLRLTREGRRERKRAIRDHLLDEENETGLRSPLADTRFSYPWLPEEEEWKVQDRARTEIMTNAHNAALKDLIDVANDYSKSESDKIAEMLALEQETPGIFPPRLQADLRGIRKLHSEEDEQKKVWQLDREAIFRLFVEVNNFEEDAVAAMDNANFRGYLVHWLVRRLEQRDFDARNARKVIEDVLGNPSRDPNMRAKLEEFDVTASHP